MFKDANFMITFQLALIGVVLIGGLFLIWKAMTRLEEKLDLLMFERDSKNSQMFREQLATAFTEPSRMTEVFEEPSLQEDLTTAESPMNMPMSASQAAYPEQPTVKGPLDQFVMFTASCPFPEKSNVVVEEVPPVPPSEADTSAEPYSKNKLRSMTVDKLKKICEDKKLDPEGTKNQLIERILAE